MPKRKRDSNDETTAPQGAAQQRVHFKLKAGVAKLAHAFKIAKGFERQKLGRRQKKAVKEKKDKDIQRIEAEIAALKTLDNSACARVYLYKTLSKIKAIAESSSLPSEVKTPKALSTDIAALNVHARLCNSNPVKEALPEVLKDVSRALGVKLSDAAAGKKKPVRAKDHDGPNKRTKPVNGTSKQRSRRDSQSESEDPSEEELASRAKSLRRGEAPENDASESGDNFAEFDNCLASSDEEDDDIASQDVDSDDDEDLDIAALEAKLASEGIRRKAAKTPKASKPTYDHAADLVITEDEDQSDSFSPEPSKAASAPRPKKSSFLPSLSMGGYISGSDGSEASDIDVAPNRKNRRGQKARQAIAEKKYGAKAKHLQKTSTSSGGRDGGWDPKRGATEPTDRRDGQRQKPWQAGKGGDGGRGGRRFPGTHGGDAAGVARKPAAKHRDDSGPIHPSWQAAKKAKESKAGVPSFQGKKITFD